MPRSLSFFDGTGSICKPFRKGGWQISSLDVDGRFWATIVEDILLWDYSQQPTPDVIFSGVPCEQYSQARTRGPPRNYALADSLAKKQREITKYFLDKNPFLLYLIENPAFSHLWKRECAQEFKNPHIVLDYCCSGCPCRKRTRLAINSNYIPRPLCNPRVCVGCPDGQTHAVTAQRGPCRGKDKKADCFTVDQLHAYPEPLVQEIFDYIQSSSWQVI